ncbi:MAG: PQQ-binding-like beta-propeller repeat protein [Gemmatimonadaceae bacterium]
MRVALVGAALLFGAWGRTAAAQAPGWGEFRAMPDNRGVIGGSLDVAWSVPMRNAVRALSVSGNILLAGADRSGELKAIDLPTGRVIWRARLPTSVHNDPVIADSIVVVTYGDLPMDTSPGGARAFDLRSGRMLWRYETRGAVMPSPALVGDIVVLAASDDCIHGVGISDGLRRYRQCIALASAMSNPKRVGTSVFFGTTEGRVVSIDGRTGAIRWIQRLPKLTHAGDATVAIGDSSLFITGTSWGGTHSFFGDKPFWVAMRGALGAFVQEPFVQLHLFFSWQRVVSLALADGAVQWSADIGVWRRVDRNQAGTPALADDVLIVSSPVALTLTALRHASGQRLWQVALPSRHRGVVTILRDTIFVGMESGLLQSYGLRTGRLLGGCQWPGAFTPTAPLVVGTTFLYGATDGVLRAVPIKELVSRMRTGGACIQP